MLIPPEVLGAHVGPPTAHTTGRTHSLAFRAATALFGHFGIEWNLLTLDDEELAELAAWVELYKRHRDLLHGGDVVRIDHDDPHAYVHGVLATDRGSALIAYVQLTTAQALLPRPVRIPELDPDVRYRVELLPAPGRRAGGWLTRGSLPVESGLELTGRQLAAHGVRLPVVNPESVELLWIEARVTRLRPIPQRQRIRRTPDRIANVARGGDDGRHVLAGTRSSTRTAGSSCSTATSTTPRWRRWPPNRPTRDTTRRCCTAATTGSPTPGSSSRPPATCARARRPPARAHHRARCAPVARSCPVRSGWPCSRTATRRCRRTPRSRTPELPTSSGRHAGVAWWSSTPPTTSSTSPTSRCNSSPTSSPSGASAPRRCGPRATTT